MAITIDGSGTITGISSVDLPDNTVQTADIADDAITTAKLPTGCILQVKQTAKTDTASHTSSGGSFSSDVMTVTITPSHADNKILITGLVHLGSATGQRCGIRLSNGGSVITGAVAATASARNLASSAAAPAGNDNSCVPLHFQYLHSPGSTAEQTYGIQISVEGNQTVYLNRSSADTDNNTIYRTASFLTVMEVAG